MPLLQNVSWAAIKALIRAQFPQVKQISTAELADWLHQPGPPPLLLDARTPEEYQVSHLANAHLTPDLDAFHSDAAVSIEQPIVVYCSVGYRSAKLAEQLQQQGYQQVFNLEGSIFEWANRGYPLYNAMGPVVQVHPYSMAWGKLLDPRYHSE